MQCFKFQVLGNRCTLKHAFWPYIYLDSSRILVYQYTVLSYSNPNKCKAKKRGLWCRLNLKYLEKKSISKYLRFNASHSNTMHYKVLHLMLYQKQC